MDIDPEKRKKLAEAGRKGGKAKNPNKGFGSMTPERRREVALKGRKAAVKNE